MPVRFWYSALIKDNMKESNIKVLYAPSLSKLIQLTKLEGIQGNKVISVLPLQEQYAMIYYE